MNRYCAVLLLIAATGAPVVKAAEQAPTCPREELLAAAKGSASPAELPARFARGEYALVRAVSLYESALGSDHYQYAALVDVRESQVWVYRYGGYNGSIAWFGPVSVLVEQLVGCPPAQGPIWLGGDRVLSGSGSETGNPPR